MSIGVVGAILVAFFSAFIGFLVQLFFKWYDRKYNANSFELSVIAEVEALINIIEKRDYRKGLEQGIFFSNLSNQEYPLEIQLQENYCPIYFNNLDKISLISPCKVKDVVKFYSILTSLALDVKPGGLLNTAPSSEAYEECLSLLDEAIEIGKRIIK